MRLHTGQFIYKFFIKNFALKVFFYQKYKSFINFSFDSFYSEEKAKLLRSITAKIDEKDVVLK